MDHSVSLGFVIFVILASINISGGANHDLYTKQEIKALDKFRPAVAKYLTLDYQKTDGYLLRWIRGNDFNLGAAAEELQNHYQWRKDNNIDTILDKDQVIPSDLPYTVTGYDKGGRPVVLQPFGKWNIRKYAVAGNQDVIVRQYQRMYEHGIRKVFTMNEQSGKDIDQIYVLTDMDGYNVREHSCLSCVPVTLNMARSFSAGVIPFSKNITLVNTPRIFHPVLDLARAIVTKLPITDYDSNKQNWQKKLFHDISRDQLPPSLGGTGR